MKCSSCGHENRDAAKFCEECAAPLGRKCTRCGAELRPAAKFCDECAFPLASTSPKPPPDPRSYTPKHLAEKILTSRSALEGERKQVTVLFADVKGSMDLAGQLDPEEWHRVLDRFFQILTDGVHRFEGSVNQYTGDGIMALFGAPIAHEDHAQRACYGALFLQGELRHYADEMRLEHGLNFSVRMGLNSGEVVVGKIGDDLRMDYTAQGPTVGLAQRMEQLAPPDGIALSQHTQKIVDGFFALRALGPVKVKGVGEAINVFVLEGVGSHRTRLDISRSRGLSRFVGRGSEIEALEAALESSLEGSGRVAAVVGEAGVGKSRLCSEFVERCRARGLMVYEAHCPMHGKTIPYLPLLELLRNLFGITDEDGPREARQKIAGELALLDDAFADDRALVLDFLGVGDPKAPAVQLEPAVRQRRLFTFLRRLIQLRTEGEPIVLLIDDLHWIDPGSDLFLAQIVEAVSTTRTLLLVNFRPEYAADWARKSWVLQLPMAPLGAESLAELVRDWVGSGPSVAGLPALVGARSSGNPFFAEEIVLSLIETARLVGTRGAYELATAIDALEVPPTVQSLLAARIDRLGEPEKQALHTAAVIGKEFSRPLLEAVVEIRGDDLEAALTALLAAELVHERAIYPVAEYAFKHPLTHEVALGAQLSAGRRARHAAVAEAIATREADRLDEQAALLAHHWDEAGDTAMSVRWHARAARRCNLDNAAGALHHWSRVWELREGAPAPEEGDTVRLDAASDLLVLGLRMGMDPQKATAIFTEGLKLAERKGDVRTRMLLLYNYAAIYNVAGDLSGGMEELNEAFELGNRSADPSLRFSVYEAMIDRLQLSGRLFEAAAVADDYVEIGRALAHGSVISGWLPAAWSIGRRAWVWSEMGRLVAAEDSLRECTGRLREITLTEFLNFAEGAYAQNRMLAGDIDGAFLHARRGLDLAEKLGSNLSRVWAHEWTGAALVLKGEWSAAVEHLDLALRVARETRSWLVAEAEILAHLAEARLGAGDAEQAQRTANEAIETGRRRKTPVWEAQAHIALARVLLARFGGEARDEIENALGSCLSLVERTGAWAHAPHVHELRAELARLLGDEATRQRELREAHRLFTEIGAPIRAAEVARELGLATPS